MGPEEVEFVEEPVEEQAVVEEEASVEEQKGVEVPELVFVRPGDVVEGEVVRIERGRYGDFIPIHKLIERADDEETRARLERLAASDAYRIVIRLGNGLVVDDVIRLSFHSRSRYSELAACYDRLAPGTRVWVKLDENGRTRITCPPRTPRAMR